MTGMASGQATRRARQDIAEHDARDLVENLAEVLGSSASLLFEDPRPLRDPTPLCCASRSDSLRSALEQAAASGAIHAVAGQTAHWQTVMIAGASHDLLVSPLAPASRDRPHELPGGLVLALAFAPLDAVGRSAAEDALARYEPFLSSYFRPHQGSPDEAAPSADALRQVIDTFGAGVMLLTEKAKLVFANREGLALLSRADGLRLRGSIVAAGTPEETARLQATVAHVGAIATGSEQGLGHQRARIIALRRAHRRSQIVTIVPYGRTSAEDSDVAALLYVLDPERQTAGGAEAVCEAYGLSRVETQLVQALVGGATIAEAAARLHVREGTARGYLKHIFAKTGTNRQSELIALIALSYPRLASNIVIGLE